jgi:Ice-binding-like/Putative Ig domain
MKKHNPFLLGVTFGVCLQAAQLPVPLGSAGTFTVLASSTVTNTGPTVINGDVGVSPGSAITGFPPGQVVGTIHATDGPAALAQGDLTTAYNDAAGRTTPIIVAGDLGGQTLTPGLYKSTSSLGITGVLKLDGQGNSNSVFIFQIASALTTATSSQVILQGGAQAANIFWQVGSSATLGTYSVFNGTILAQASVSVLTGAALNGRALARTGAVTLDTNTAVNPGPAATGGTPGALAVTCPASSAQIGLTYNSIVGATGGTPPYTFSTTGSLPPGLNLTPSTGVVSGIPTALGLTSFTANAADSAAGNASRACTITVTVPPTPPPTPAPASLILVLIGFSCTALYFSRERFLRLVRRS